MTDDLTANKEPTERKYPGLKPFVKGDPRINRTGRPRKLHITKIYEKILRNSNNRKAIEDSVLKMLMGGRMVAQLTLKEMAERTEGKISQAVDLTGDLNVNVTMAEIVQKARKRAAALNDDKKVDEI